MKIKYLKVLTLIILILFLVSCSNGEKNFIGYETTTIAKENEDYEILGITVAIAENGQSNGNVKYISFDDLSDEIFKAKENNKVFKCRVTVKYNIINDLYDAHVFYEIIFWSFNTSERVGYYGNTSDLKLYSKGIHYISFDIDISNDTDDRCNITNVDSVSPYLKYEFRKVLE